MNRLSRRLLPLAGLATLVSAGPSLGASCLPEFDQPDLTPGYKVGVLKSTQGSKVAKALGADMFIATWQRLEIANPDEVVIFSDADIANAAKLAEVKVLVLPNSRALSSAQRKALTSWVKGGGGLVSLYQSGRDTPAGQQILPPTKPRRAPKALPAWGELSSVYGAGIFDIGMRQAVFGVVASNPVGQAATTFCGGPIPAYTWRRGDADVAVTGELAKLGATAKPLVRVKAAKVRAGGRKVPPSSIMGWTNAYGAGRVVHVGFNMMDSWRNYTFETYYEAVDPDAPETTVALLRGSIEWASGVAPTPTA